ncbi:RsmB/NOP family class I SAM-dependent RNA methyltransferase [Aestuariivirga sp.]|uniref:RsmB/NOP family class I SAM-dependent RNA methyltransferase n=1 Tax=Aestuariivirga sp. TaxID=2650926 RepID=UPI0035949440
MSAVATAPKGLEVRQLAASLVERIVRDGLTIEESLRTASGIGQLESRDRSFLHVLLLTIFRHRGEIEWVLKSHLAKPLPRKSGPANFILWVGIAELLFLGVPVHAAIDQAVRSARTDRNATHFSGLVNAVLRKIAAQGKADLESSKGPPLNTPGWLWWRWSQNYGAGYAREIDKAHRNEPFLDISVKTDPEEWATRIGGMPLPTGSVRLSADHAGVTELPGFSEGEWWVQDAAAALPVRLLGDVRGREVLDLCAAPGGKTMQLIAAGASVTAVDSSPQRLSRLRENLARTGMTAEIVEADVRALGMTKLFDAVLLDAPCSATGTIRRHPELAYLKTEPQILQLAKLQAELLSCASARVAPGGLLVFCTCSLEPEEGEQQVEKFLAAQPGFEIVEPLVPGLPSEFVMPEGWIRTLPFMKIGASEGLDGFFAVALRRRT